jgi:hypothetical protein
LIPIFWVSQEEQAIVQRMGFKSDFLQALPELTVKQQRCIDSAICIPLEPGCLTAL